MRAFAAATLVVVLMGAPTTALAASPSRYTPVDPSAATLAGSAVTTQCRSGDPWVDYRVRLTDPGGSTASAEVVLVIERGSRSATIALGALSGGVAEGSIPWPSGPAAAAGGASASAVIRVVPSTAPSLRLPLAARDCATTDTAALAVTGLSGWVPTLGVAGAALVIIGALVATRRRRRTG